jgi:predicted ATPase/DNA-binding SARP family transcriptional activator
VVTVSGKIEVALLGPVEVRAAGAAVPVASVPQRVVLARLALSPDRPVPASALVAALWVDEPPANATGNLHSYVSKLRRLLGAELITSDAAGYRLRVAPGDVDIGRVERLAAEGRALAGTDAARAAGVIDQALAVWRGEPLADLPEPLPFAPTLARLREWRQQLREEWFELRLAAGDAAGAVPGLTEAAAGEPLREGTHLLLMRALHQSHRTPEALRVADQFRRRTIEESGLDPSPAFSDLQRRLLADDPTLRAPALRDPAPASRRRPPADRLVGRQRELNVVAESVRSHRLVTVVGPGGVGKTRLVLEVLGRLSESGHRHLVELGDVSSTADVPAAVATALRLQAAPGGVENAIADLLVTAPMLLVLDNCEHVLPATVGLVRLLLQRCPALTVLATSRRRLGMAAERVVPLGPLSVAEQVELFCDRAALLRPDFEPSDRQRGQVADICRTLDGLPLAVELAAHREAVFGIAQLRERLSAGLEVLEPARSGGRSTAVTATVEWSYRLLDPEAQALFDRLATCRGGFTLAALDHLAPAGTANPLALLTELVEASLVAADLATDPPRYRLLEIMRRVGHSHLTPDGLADARDAHARWVGHEIAELYRRKLDDGAAAGQRLRREVANTREALAWLIGSDQWEAAASIGVMLGLILSDEPYLDLCDQLRRMEPPLHLSGDVDSLRAVAAGVAAWVRGDNRDAERLLTAALAHLPAEHPQRWVGHFVRVMNGVLVGDPAAVEADARRLRDDPEVPSWVAATGVCAAVLINLFQGERERAEQWAVREQRLLDEVSRDDGFVAYTRGELAAAADPPLALTHFEQAWQQCDRQGHTYAREVAGVGRASVLIRLGRHADAVAACRKLLENLRAMGMWPQVWTVLRLTAELLVSLDDPEPAAILLAAADSDRLAPPVLGADRDRQARLWATISGRLTPQQVAAARATGLSAGHVGAVETGLHALVRHC